ncbi:hypothetical protein A2U01_0109511, partial [Trifolium medium]|nr:hypothetical protein [Trifolium medium]
MCYPALSSGRVIRLVAMSLHLAFVWLPVPVDMWATRPAIAVSHFLFLSIPGP